MDDDARYRYRLTFSKGEAMRFTSHLDLYRAWERCFRRANLPLLYSQGYTPRPKINIGLPLPLGLRAEREYLDLWLTEGLPAGEIHDRLRQTKPPGLKITELEAIDPHTPKLQKRIIAANYRASFPESTLELEQLKDKVEALLAAETHHRERRGKRYDLRPLIEELEVETDEDSEGIHLSMRLKARPNATGRADEVLLSLGLNPEQAVITRDRIWLETNGSS